MDPLLKTPEIDAPAQLNQGLIGGLECLLALAGADNPLGSRELARELGMEPTRVNRLLGTLAHLGLAQKTPNRKYMPGNALHILAAMSLRGSRLLKVALPLVEDLSRRTKHSVALGVLWGRRVCYLLNGKAGKNLSASIGGNTLYPAAQSSIGKILLAERDEREIRALYRNNPDPVDPHFHVDLRNARSDGFAFGATGSIAVPIGTPPVAGLAISDVDDRKEALMLLDDLEATARAIADAIRDPH